MEEKRSRAIRFEVLVSPKILGRTDASRAAWHETPEDVAAGLEWGREKARLLRWVRKQMRGRLTKRERRCVELYFFENLTYREAGERTGTNASSVFRAVRRGLRKLGRAASADGPRPARRQTRSTG